MTAPGGAGDRFLHNVTHHFWADNGKSVASLFDWTGPAAQGPEGQIAGETAHAYSSYIGSHPDELLKLPGNHTLGQVNPDLTQGMAHGLTPYVTNIAGEHNALTGSFGAFDTGATQDNDFMSTSKGVFSVLNTDPQAAQLFDGKAYEEILRDQNSYAKGIAENVPNAVLDNARMQQADTLRALIDVGTNNALDAKGVNADLQAADAYASKSSAYDLAVKTLSAGADASPGGPVAALGADTLGSALKSDIIGTPPVPSAHPALYSNMTEYEADRAVLNGLIANGTHVNLPADFFGQGDGGSDIKGFAEYSQHPTANTLAETHYNTAVRDALASIVGTNNVAPIGMEKDTYNNITKNPHPWS